MKEIIKSVKDFKIIPANFKSAGTFELLEVVEDVAKIKLILADDSELKDYKVDSYVEVFGVNNIGLVYFETKILSLNNDIATIALIGDYSIIQRREYSRVELDNGSILFEDLPSETVKFVEDIFAGGLKFVANHQFELDKHYSISIKLSNNMKINCKFQPIRVVRENDNYMVSGKFLELENMDRIVLVQYAFKTKMEKQSKNSEIG